MMRAVDASLKNVTDAYKRLGVWGRTVVIMSTDNGGNTDTGSGLCQGCPPPTPSPPRSQGPPGLKPLQTKLPSITPSMTVSSNKG